MSRWAAAVLLPALLAGCATPLQAPISGYTCCNLRDYKGWISSDNVLGGALVPAGEPVRITTIKRHYYAYGVVGGQELGLRDDQAKRPADTTAWLQQVVVDQDPRERLATWPRDVRLAVQAGKVLPGMTREQVLMALGHPPRSLTPEPADSVWRYLTLPDDQAVDLLFDMDGRLSAVTGPASAQQRVLMEP